MKCKDIIHHMIIKKVDNIFEGGETIKQSQIIKDLEIAANKFYVLLSEEIIAQYCQLNEKKELDEKEKWSFKEAQEFFMKMYDKGAHAATEIIDRINQRMAEYLDTKI